MIRDASRDFMRRLVLGVLLLLAGDGLAEDLSAPSVPRSDEIRGILSERIDDQKRSVGMVVGIVEPQGRRLISHGHFTKDRSREVNGNTVFEIGSVTKVFTALALADMVHRDEVAARDPVAMYLPDDVIVPRRKGKAIVLEDLATHRSGLPRLPDNLSPKDENNPYADYTVGQLYEFLSRYRLTRDIGAQREYSNLGYGLLGHVLARRAGKSYEALVRDRISAPLKMRSTGITLPPDVKARLATGHDVTLKALPNWDWLMLPGAGALRSTANDLLNFLDLLLGQKDLSLAPSVEAALDWVATKSGDGEMVWKNGGTSGYRSFIGILPNAKVGVVVLSNSTTSVDDIGQHLLNSDLPLVPPPRERTVATRQS